ncbi:molybdopterin-dependent oxidoreductase [Solimicrobium silvestre]|uniref:Oxidoreductase molybdopterin binding domain n=1 Tax=Solimicrobium silvestre TaxID=2099400 RepID=A0A2S9GYB8_9BURK|nr:molybdopterin-dependent oxidoreductase [Solimicrobium silvestre]PRC92714.1 Oxidoreductase molybdopterin binding domain [Solimicrobium silvestre]
MEKRQFLSSGLVLGTLLIPTLKEASATIQNASAQIILTITGDIKHVNRDKSDVVKDQLMHKQGVHFERAYTFALSDLENLRAKTISPTLEYDARIHQLSGPRLMDVLELVGVNKTKHSSIIFHGIDGYSPEISLALAEKYDYILATKLDGQLLSVGGFGPLFAIYDADRLTEIAQKPLNQRFDKCPWGLYCIEVVA